jgi:hypothetical protein
VYLRRIAAIMRLRRWMGWISLLLLLLLIRISLGGSIVMGTIGRVGRSTTAAVLSVMGIWVIVEGGA